MRTAATGWLLVGVLAAALALTSGGAVHAQDPASEPLAEQPGVFLSIAVAPDTVTIGDRFSATINLRLDEAAAAAPRFPVWEEHWGDAEILVAGEPTREAKGLWRQVLVLAAFKTGETILPPITVVVPTAGATLSATSEPASITVESVLPEAEGEIPPQPPAPVRELPAGSGFWWTLGILGAAVLALGYFVWRSANRVRRALEVLSLSPSEAFERAIARLRAEPIAENIFVGLSLELRRYIGRSLGFPAAEGTTTEIQRSLRERHLSPELVRETLALLREADQIKFARGDADPSRAGRRLDDAVRLAKAVEAVLTPATEASEAAA